MTFKGMDSEDTIAQWEVNGKWIYTGTLVLCGDNNGSRSQKLWTVFPVKKEQLFYHAHIGLSMLSAVGGSFDDEDTVFADIYEVDGKRQVGGSSRYTGPPDYTTNVPIRPGYVYGHHFGILGSKNNQGASVYLGPIRNEIVLRLFVRGDDYAAASWSVVEL